MRILVTGATGFVGSALIKHLALQDYTLTAAVRDINNRLPHNIPQVVIGDLQNNTDWQVALDNIDVVIHLAARAHVMNDTVDDPLTEFRRINTEATLNLAQQAAAIGVKRFIFLSSIKVNGEETKSGSSFQPDDDYIPTDPYGLSKYEAEQGLKGIAKYSNMEFVIIRPPLVYGENVKGNFQSLIKLISSGVPLPLGSIKNKRSLVALDNLVDLISICIEHPSATNQVFLVSDNHDLSTTELLFLLKESLNSKTILLPLPPSLLQYLFNIFKQERISQRLLSNLQVDITKTQEILQWNPPHTIENIIKK